MSLFNEILNPIEYPLLRSFHDALSCGFLDATMPYVTYLCKAGMLWILIGVVLLFFRKTRRVGIAMLISLALGLILCNGILKPLSARIRPYPFDPSISTLVKPEKEFSFPSGHTIASFEGAVSIFLRNKKYGIAALVVAVLISFSRLYLMMHYFTDVIVAALLGTLIAIFAKWLTDRLLRKTDLPV